MTLQDIGNTSYSDGDNKLLIQINSCHDLFDLRFLVCNDNQNPFLRVRSAKAFYNKIATTHIKDDGRIFSSFLTQLSKLKVSTATKKIFFETMDHLAKMATPQLRRFSARDIAFTLHALSKRMITNKTIFETVGESMLSNFQDFWPKDISMILCSFSRIGYGNMKCIGPLADMIIPELDSYDCGELSGVAYAFSTFQDVRKDVLTSTATAAIGISSTFTATDLAHLLQSLSTAGYWNEELGEVMAEQAIAIMNRFNRADVSHLAGVYFKNGHSHPELFHAISKHVIKIVETLNPEDIMRIFQSFINMNQGKHTIEIVGSLNAADLTFRSFSNLNQGYHSFFDGLASAAIRTMDSFEAKHLNGVIYACGKLRYFNADLFNEIAESCILKMDSFGASDLKLLAKSFSVLRYYHGDLVTELGRELVSENGIFHVAILMHVMDGFADLNLKPFALPRLLARCESVIPILDTAEELRMIKTLSRLQVQGNCIDMVAEKISKNCPDLANEEILEVAKAFTIIRYKKTMFWTAIGKEILCRDDTKWTPKDLGILSSAFGSMSLSLCVSPRVEVVSKCFKLFQQKDSSEVTIQDVSAVSSAIPFAEKEKLFPSGFIDHVLELAILKAHESRHDDVRCVLINFSKLDLPVSSRRKFLGTYRDVFNEVSLFLKPDDYQKITELYRELDQIRDDTIWANNFSFFTAY